MKNIFRPRQIQNALGYFLAAACVSRLFAVLLVYPLAATVLPSSVALNEVPAVSFITSAVHGFLFAWTSFLFLHGSRPGRPTLILNGLLAIIFLSTVGSVSAQIKASGSLQYGSAEADSLVLMSAIFSVLAFILPYVAGRAIFAPMYKKLRESADSF